jgi:hypothetical protein
MQPWRVSMQAIVELQHFDKEQDLDPDLHRCERSDPDLDPDQSKGSDTNPH